jgi:hypothetical protein
MFGNNAFGSLGVDSNNQAGPSRKQVQGEEIDIDVSYHQIQITVLSANMPVVAASKDESRC